MALGSFLSSHKNVPSTLFLTFQLFSFLFQITLDQSGSLQSTFVLHEHLRVRVRVHAAHQVVGQDGSDPLQRSGFKFPEKISEIGTRADFFRNTVTTKATLANILSLKTENRFLTWLISTVLIEPSTFV